MKLLALLVAMTWFATDVLAAMDIVRDGKAMAGVVAEADAQAAKPHGRMRKKARGVEGSDAYAARVLVDWIHKISGTTMKLKTSAPANASAIYIGAASIKAGLRIDDIDSASHEGVRIVV